MRRKLTVLFAVLAVTLSACGSGRAMPSVDDTPLQNMDTIYPEWDADTVYTQGDTVIFNDQYFRALWWNRATEPTQEDKGTPWRYLGDVPRQQYRTFNDVQDGTWYAEAIDTLAADGIVCGTNGSFYPTRPLTRAQFAVMLCRAFEIEPSENAPAFRDAEKAWYTPYLNALKENGLLSGDGTGNFRPNDVLTRQELSAMLYAAFNGFSEDPLTVFAPYSDTEDVAAWAIRPLSWCLQRGILQPVGDNLMPNAPCSRADGASALFTALYKSNSAS